MADGLVTLVEITAYDPSVTNKLIRSEELDNAVWSKTAVTIAANAATAPDGSLSADTMVETAANAFHVVAQYTTGFTAGVPVMASGHLKANGRSRVRVQTDTSPNNGTADFDLATGTAGTITGIASAPRLIPLGNGWWRFAVIWTPASSAAMGIKLILASSTYGVAYLGDGVSGMHGWGFMLDPSGTLNDTVRTTSVAGPGTRVLRFASGRGRMTGPGDVPPHVHLAPRLQQPVNFSRTLFSNARVTGGSKVGVGEMVLNNTDQGLAYLRDLGIDGRDITIRVTCAVACGVQEGREALDLCDRNPPTGSKFPVTALVNPRVTRTCCLCSLREVRTPHRALVAALGGAGVALKNPATTLRGPPPGKSRVDNGPEFISRVLDH